MTEVPNPIHIWDKSITIISQITQRTNGKLQSFCGLKITNTGNCMQPTTQLSTNIPEAYTSSHANVAYNKLDEPTINCQFCNAVMWKEEKTSKSTEENVKFSICCQEGKVSLERLQETPTTLKHLLQDKGHVGTNFRQKIRIYNSMFCFTSFGGQIDDSINRSRGPYTFRISGQNYHRFGALLPQEGHPPTYCQLYFFNTGIEIQNRMTCIDHDRDEHEESIVRSLIDMFDSHSCVAQAFRMARYWCNEHNTLEVKINIIGQRQPQKRQYNMPSVAEIAALVVGDFGQCNGPRDVLIQSKTSGLQRISDLHPLYMALQYPLLFPYGEDGYHENILYQSNTGNRKTKRDCVTMKEFYSYRLQQRTTEGTTLLQGGRLFQQYVVDAYTTMEEQRLRWLKLNQDNVRADLYHNICDAVTRGDTEAKTIGKRIVLPSTFTGSPRYMIQNYQDAMAICRALGNPALFITFTANPKWLEVDEMLSKIQGQTPADRPDIMTRIFKLKLAQLMKDILKDDIFGKHSAVVYTIEFQKRGLPHVHILLWLEKEAQGKTTKDIDDIISAEIPCIEEDPAGYKAVTEHMLHGPCGEGNKNAPCMINGACNKHFPKAFYAETTIDEEGFPIYRRRNNGVHVKKGRTKLDNRFVVPYNRYLLLKYQAHINVEWCNRSRAIKYLFKYLHKGPDRATILLEGKNMQSDPTSSHNTIEVDEIKQYLECRYLSPCEGAWRIFGFDIHYSAPSIMRLTFHLPNQNSITLKDSQSLPAVLRRERLKDTIFTEWFTLNIIDAEARKYTYAEVPKNYVWSAKEKVWKRRKQGRSIGRILYCHPASGERYYLRMLLNVVKGPRSFEEIRTVNGKIYDSFKKACYALGMLNEDKEWIDAIEEAKLWATAVQLRELFVTILLFCDVSDPKGLWEKNWESLSEDIEYRKRKEFRYPDLQLSENQRKNYCLLHIQELLNKNGKSLSEYPDLPMPDKSLLTNMDNRLIQEEMRYNCVELAREHHLLHTSLNIQQHAVYDSVIASVQKQEGGFFFVYGPGGTGKTFLYKTIIARLRSERAIVLAVASSGIASLLLPGGRTAHSRFVIPLELLDNSTCGISQNTHLAELMSEVKLIIWDEAPMTQRFAFEALDRTLKDIRGTKREANREKLFGGISVLLGGDFRQILPVIPKGRRQEIVQACINNSPLWNHCQVLTLSRSMRVNERDEHGRIDYQKKKFNQWILQVGEGVVPTVAKQQEDEATWIEIPEEFIVPAGADPIKRIVEEIYGGFFTEQQHAQYLRERAILTPLNEDADQINEHMFKCLNGIVRTYNSSDEICQASMDTDEQQHLYPVEFLNTLQFPGMPPHILHLKEGLPVMLLRNVNPSEGLCNGTRLIICRLGAWVIEAEIITGSNLGKKVIIPRITLKSTKSKWPFIMKRRQFPIKPCFAMTINKSQGQSLNFVGIYLSKPVFSHGQLYVAISRVTNPKGLKILMVEQNDQTNNQTRNIVFKEAFNNLPTHAQEHEQGP